MAIHSTTGGKGPPSTWTVKLFANTSGNEEFVRQVLELHELADASLIFGEPREKLKNAISAVLIEGLMPAFEHLKKIRDSAIRPMPELNRKQVYEDFSRVLWHAYKDLAQKAAKMMEPEIGLLFSNEAGFEAGLAQWAQKRPEFVSEVEQYLRVTRADWQNELANFRNYLEHKDERDPGIYIRRYSPDHAERLFYAVWQTTVDILAMLISLHLPQGMSLLEIPEEKRHPVTRKRFSFFVKGVSDRVFPTRLTNSPTQQDGSDLQPD
jgi:hypothetical protein